MILKDVIGWLFNAHTHTLMKTWVELKYTSM